MNSTALALLLTGILLGAWLTAVQAAASPHQLSQNYIGSCDTAVTIMPLGDSITQGKSSGVTDDSKWIAYRKDLWDSLIANGYNVDFVGSNLNGQAYPGFDADHQGEGGVTNSWVANRVYNFLKDNPADVVLLHIGTNNLSDSPESTENVEKILDKIDDYESDYNREVTVILARIINRVPYSQTTTNYNNNVAAMAQVRINNDGDKIILVDMENGAGIVYQYIANGGDMFDYLHPHTTGYAKMAGVWYSALAPLLPPCVSSSPNINPINDATAYTNTLYQYQVVATGSPAPTFSLMTSPGGMTINSSTGLIAWTPTTSQAGQHTVMVKATNSVGSDTELFTIEVLKPELTTTISPDTQLINSGAAAGFTVAISNTGDVPLSVVVAAPQAPDCARSATNLAPTESLNYTCTKANVTQDFTNVITATGTFTPPTSGPITVVASGTAFVDVRPTIEVQQNVAPTSLPEPGGPVNVSLTITNTSLEPVTLTALATTPFGDVTNPGNALITNTSCAKVTIGSGGEYTCSFSATFSGQPGEYNLVTTVKGKDNEGNEASATTSSPLAITNLASSIDVTLTAVPPTIPEPGGAAHFTVTVTNTSPADSVKINSLNDQLLGSLHGKGSCSLPTGWLAPGSAYQCTFTVMISGTAGQNVTNQVTASGMDDDGQQVSGSSPVSTVAIDDKTIFIFLPFITNGN